MSSPQSGKAKKLSAKIVLTRDSNPIVFFDVRCVVDESKNSDVNSQQTNFIGRLYFELRSDLVPHTCANFLSLVSGSKGTAKDGINYCYKNTKIHRICRDILFQAGDLLGENGNCSKSVYNDGGLFSDENFILRHCGPGVLSMCNRGPDTNGSLFQVTMRENPEMVIIFNINYFSSYSSFKFLILLLFRIIAT